MKTSRILLLLTILGLTLGCAGSRRTAKSDPPVVPGKTVVQKNALNPQLENLTEQIVTSLSQKQKSKIAVIEFSNLQGKVTQFGMYLAEELITRLYRTNRFEVIERQLLNKVLQEHKLNMSGIIDASSAKELGRILGVDAIASGSVTDLGNNVKVNARLISTETGKIFSVASVTIFKDEVVRKLMGESISGNPSPSPAGPKANKTPGPYGTGLDMVSEVGNFTFHLQSCVMEGRTITCSLIATNNTEDESELVIWLRPTKIYDQSGNEFPVCSVSIANSHSRPNPSCEWGGSYRLEKMLVPGVPTPVELVFNKVSSETNQVTLLQLSLGSKGYAKFRDVPMAY
ncbi:MAG: FlgO family outer membrane protein [Calditrichia bacterium]